jgi:hypothetical protein
MKFACNYAVIRFLPYPETGEFACIGVSLICPETGYFDYKLELKRRDRIAGFFPELTPQVFTQGRLLFAEELTRLKTIVDNHDMNQMQFEFAKTDITEIFKELIRPRESLFRFSPTSTVLTDDPAAELTRLFNDYVYRQFAQHEEYQEQIMTKKVRKILQAEDIAAYVIKHLGDNNYCITVPLVRGDIKDPKRIRAIKPLNMAQADSTKILEHGDRWHSRINRLKKLNYVPANFLFPIRVGEKGKNAKAVKEACKLLGETGAHIVEIAEHDKIVRFARTA